MDSLVEFKNVTKKFKRINALQDVDLSIERGKIVGLIGPNTAGKSTLLRHIIGMYLPTRGHVQTLGKATNALGYSELSRIGYVHQEAELIDWLRVDKMVSYVSAHYESWNNDIEAELKERFEIDYTRCVAELTPGARQKLALLLSLSFEPEFLILDEPAAALDPGARSDFLETLLEQIQKPGRTIIISSHILSDIEKIVDHIVMMNRGRIVIDTDFDDLRDQYQQVSITATHSELPELSLPNILDCKRDEYQANFITTRENLTAAENFAREAGCELLSKPLRLEELYPYLVKKSSAKEGMK